MTWQHLRGLWREQQQLSVTPGRLTSCAKTKKKDLMTLVLLVWKMVKSKLVFTLEHLYTSMLYLINQSKTTANIRNNSNYLYSQSYMPNIGVHCCWVKTVPSHSVAQWWILRCTTRYRKTSLFVLHLLNADNTFSKTICCLWQRCIYATCNCEKSEDCLCAVLSSYARACASKGVLLTDWRDNVCGKYFFRNIVVKLSNDFCSWMNIFIFITQS